jgi:phospholipase/carboxylesterase
VLQRPRAAAEQLVLLFHGVGGVPEEMVPIGRRLAAEFPNAFVVSVAAAHASDLGTGRQWFSIRGITEENRPARVAAALPLFRESIREWQRAANVAVEATAVVGFSQGGIMALESTRSSDAPAGRIVSIAGRFARPPDHAPPQMTLHLVHGRADTVIPYAHTVLAGQLLLSLGADVTADVLPFVGHEINGDVANRLIERLKSHVPRRLWEAALRQDPGPNLRAHPIHGDE